MAAHYAFGPYKDDAIIKHAQTSHTHDHHKRGTSIEEATKENLQLLLPRLRRMEIITMIARELQKHFFMNLLLLRFHC